jgi:hypothetical protein
MECGLFETRLPENLVKKFEFAKKDFLKIHEKKHFESYQYDYYFENMKKHCYYLRMKRNSLILK